MSTDARPSICRSLAQVSAEVSVDYRPSVGRDVGWLCWWSMAVEYVSGVCRSICRPILDRHSTHTIGRDLDRHLANISAETRPTSWSTLGQDIDRHLVECRPRCLSSMSVEESTECGPTDRPIVATDLLQTWVEFWPSLDQVSVDISPKCRQRCRSSIGRVSAEMAGEYMGGVCRSISRPILDKLSTDSDGRYLTDSVGRHSTDSAGWYSTDNTSADNRLTLDR